MAQIVVVDHVTKSFIPPQGGEMNNVLKDISFTQDDGEIVSVIGPTGCGKSTLLRIIAGIITPDSGSVTVSGRGVSLSDPACAVVFQNFNLFPWRTAIKNIEVGLEAKGIGPEERSKIAEHFIDLVGLKGFEEYHPHQLSGGMQQRVGLARALAIDPKVILLDEPFGSVDMLTRDSLRDEVAHILLEAKKTALFVTHNIDEAIFLSNRIIVLGGRPSSIRTTFNVNLPYPRTDDVYLSDQVIKLKMDLKEHLVRDNPGQGPKTNQVGS
jgi:ABC-type nitrate/sulfonate/bicarbonate transport system ATPase subunit